MTSNVTEFYKQSRQVLPAKPTGLVSKARVYCLQLPRVLQALLASRTSVSRETCLCCSRAMQASLFLCCLELLDNEQGHKESPSFPYGLPPPH